MLTQKKFQTKFFLTFRVKKADILSLLQMCFVDRKTKNTRFVFTQSAADIERLGGFTGNVVFF